MPDTINPGVPAAKYGVLWRTKPIPTDDTPPGWTEYSGYWYDDIAPALKDLDRAAVHPRCEDARVFAKKITFTELTENAVEWIKEKQKE